MFLIILLILIYFNHYIYLFIFTFQERSAISLNVDLLKLGFLGSGFPLFYNYLKNCILMLTSLFLFQGIPNILINSKGKYCESTELEAFEHAIE